MTKQSRSNSQSAIKLSKKLFSAEAIFNTVRAGHIVWAIVKADSLVMVRNILQELGTL